MSDKTYLGNAAATLSTSPKLGEITKVIINIDDDTSVVVGQDETGSKTLEVDIPLTTTAQAQTIGQAIINRLDGFQYQPYEAGTAILNPAMELGDGITTNGVYSGIYSQSIKFGSLLASDISAPYSAEKDHEYEYKSTSDRKITRKFAEVNAELEIKATQIAACVKKDSPTGQSSFAWELHDDHFAIKRNGSNVFYINASGAEFAGTVKANAISVGTMTIGGQTVNAGYITGGQIGTYEIGSNNCDNNVRTGIADGYWSVDALGGAYATSPNLTAQTTYGIGNGHTMYAGTLYISGTAYNVVRYV